MRFGIRDRRFPRERVVASVTRSNQGIFRAPFARRVGLHLLALPVAGLVLSGLIVADEIRQGRVGTIEALARDVLTGWVFGFVAYVLAAIPAVVLLLIMERLPDRNPLTAAFQGSILASVLLAAGVYVGLRLLSTSINNAEFTVAIWTVPAWATYGALAGWLMRPSRL